MPASMSSRGMRVGESATWMPAASSAATLPAAVPAPPLMIAPAWPMRRPGGAVRPAMKAAIGLWRRCSAAKAAARSSASPADLADEDHGVGRRVVAEAGQDVHEVGAHDRVAADADAGRLADATRR